MQKQIASGEFHMRRSYADYRRLFNPVVEIKLPDTGFILDSGCGMGHACRELAQRDQEHLCVIGITITRTPTVYPVIYYDLEQPLTKRLKYTINACLDIYGAISYSCYPIRVIQNILDIMNKDGRIYIFCTFNGRLTDIHTLIYNTTGLLIDYFDDCRMVLIKTGSNVCLDDDRQNYKFYAGSMAVKDPN